MGTLILKPFKDESAPMKISVLVMTYNHEQFIGQAMASVLSQRCPFDFEIVVSEDCSTDATRDIVQQYQREYPERVRLLLSEHNIHSNAIVVRGIEAASGEYIALLDGDDYWCSTEKLQKQAEFLDSHPECSICFHNARVITEGGDRQEWNWTPPDHPEITTFERLWFGNFIATSSTMFRRGLIKRFPPWYDGFFPITDWPLHILNAEHGRIGYIKEIMAVYRYHKGGYYSQLSEREKQAETLKFYQRINRDMDYRYDGLAKTAISKYFMEWAEEYLKRGDMQAARACYKTGLTGRPVNEYMSLKKLLRMALRLYGPLAVRGRARHGV